MTFQGTADTFKVLKLQMITYILLWKVKIVIAINIQFIAQS